MTSAVESSPDSLQLRGKVNVGARLGRRAGAIIAAVVALVIILVIFNTENRRHQLEDKPREAKRDATKALAPATQTADAFNAKISDEVKISPPPAAVPAASASVAQPPAAIPPLVLQGQTQVPEIAATDAAKALQQTRENELKAAREAPSKASSWQADAPSAPIAAPPASGGTPEQRAQAAQLQAAADQARAAIGAAGAGGEAADQNGQAKKLAFLQGNAELASPILAATRQPQRTPYELKTGTVIPGILLQGINSDLPGEMVALVTQTVYDTATGTQVLIPQGSKLFGRYDSSVTYGQEGALVAWSRLIYPDGSTLELGGMQGDAPNGYSGFRDKVNNHYGRLVGFAVLTSLFSAGYQLSQPQQATSANGQLSNQQVIGGAVGQQVTQLGMEITRKNLSIQPTIEIRPGYRFVVMVNRDIVFARPYVP